PLSSRHAFGFSRTHAQPGDSGPAKFSSKSTFTGPAFGVATETQASGMASKARIDRMTFSALGAGDSLSILAFLGPKHGNTLAGTSFASIDHGHFTGRSRAIAAAEIAMPTESFEIAGKDWASRPIHTLGLVK